jgi:hypothetical protein
MTTTTKLQSFVGQEEEKKKKKRPEWRRKEWWRRLELIYSELRLTLL